MSEAPQLTRALVLETPERSPDGAGGYAESWRALGTLWAAITPRTGRETGGQSAVLSRVPLRIIVRAAPPGAPGRPRAGQRFVEGSRVFAILSVTEADSAARFLRCEAEEEVAT